MAKGHSYQGQHWTQKPENRARLLKMLSKPRKKVAKKYPHVTKAERVIAREAKKVYKKHNVEETVSVVLNGWKLTLGHRNIKVELA